MGALWTLRRQSLCSAGQNSMLLVATQLSVGVPAHIACSRMLVLMVICEAVFGIVAATKDLMPRPILLMTVSGIN